MCKITISFGGIIKEILYIMDIEPLMLLAYTLMKRCINVTIWKMRHIFLGNLIYFKEAELIESSVELRYKNRMYVEM